MTAPDRPGCYKDPRGGTCTGSRRLIDSGCRDGPLSSPARVAPRSTSRTITAAHPGLHGMAAASTQQRMN